MNFLSLDRLAEAPLKNCEKVFQLVIFTHHILLLLLFGLVATD
jgi:hypothetical protein